MEIETESTVRIKLTLEHDEALWLMCFIQNYPYQEPENSVEERIRCDLFKKLHSELD